MLMTGMYFLAGSVVIAAFGMVGIGVYGQMEEKRIYEEKVTALNLIILRQNKERTDKEQKEREEYIRGSK
jgi:hypothetical protein